MMSRKYRVWEYWATTEELSAQWKVSQRRVQQLLSDLKEKNQVEVGVLVLDIGTINPISKPVYKMVDQT